MSRNKELSSQVNTSSAGRASPLNSLSCTMRLSLNVSMGSIFPRWSCGSDPVLFHISCGSTLHDSHIEDQDDTSQSLSHSASASGGAVLTRKCSALSKSCMFSHQNQLLTLIALIKRRLMIKPPGHENTRLPLFDSREAVNTREAMLPVDHCFTTSECPLDGPSSAACLKKAVQFPRYSIFDRHLDT